MALDKIPFEVLRLAAISGENPGGIGAYIVKGQARLTLVPSWEATPVPARESLTPKVHRPRGQSDSHPHALLVYQCRLPFSCIGSDAPLWE